MADTFSIKRKMMFGVVLALLIMVLSPVSAFASEIASDSNAEEFTVYTLDEVVSSGDAVTLSETETTEEEETTVEVVAYDYTTQFETVVYLLEYITGILVFFVVVILCKFAYSFFNIFL